MMADAEDSDQPLPEARPSAPNRLPERLPGSGSLGRTRLDYLVENPTFASQQIKGIANAPLDDRESLRLAVEELTQTKRTGQIIALIAIAAAVAAMATSFAALATQPSESFSATVLTSFATTITGFVGGAVGFYFGRQRRASPSERSAHRAASLEDLLATLRDIEIKGSRAASSDPRLIAVSRLIPDLVHEGLWTDEDAQTFRSILRLRNGLVHGAAQDAGEGEAAGRLSDALNDAHRLLAKLD